MMLYVINEYIEFRAGENQLTLKGQPHVSVKLTCPAAQCLEIMLEQPGNIVPHAELYRRVWEEKGMNIPPNTLYQNVSIIRRALKGIVSDGDKIIMTVPRKGFRIHHDAVVESVDIGHFQPVAIEVVSTGDNVLLQPGQETVSGSNKWNRKGLLFPLLGKIMTTLSLLLISASSVEFPVVGAKAEERVIARGLPSDEELHHQNRCSWNQSIYWR